MTLHCELKVEHKQASLACELHPLLQLDCRWKSYHLTGKQENHKNTILRIMKNKIEGHL